MLLKCCSVLLLLACGAHGARILGLFPFPVRSHMNVYSSLMRELAGRGHQVTVLSSFPQDPPLPNYTDLVMRNFKDKIDPEELFSMNKMNVFQKFFTLWNIGLTLTDIAFQQPAVQQLINSKDQQFDLVIVASFVSEAFLGFAHKFKVPVIAICPFAGVHWMGDMVGNPNPYAYVPEVFTTFNDHMSFTERLINTVSGTFGRLGHKLFYLPKQDAMMKKYFNDSGEIPNVAELQTKISLLMVNQQPSLSFPRPLVPNLVQVGGMHIKPPKKLPQDLQKFLDDATNGVIYFSMGSVLYSSQLPEAKRQALTEAFSTLKQKVLWKWETDVLPGQPANVKLGKWLPQADILAHPNIRLFITHGGLLSSQEAVYHGVPVLGIPVLGDQELNMAKAEAAGYGLKLDFTNITAESLKWAIGQMLHQASYRDNAKRLSRLSRDELQTPMERAVYWTEYVLRHGGANHLRSAALDLACYQYQLLDVLAVLLGGALAVVLAVYLAIRAVFRTLITKGKPQNATKARNKKMQ